MRYEDLPERWKTKLADYLQAAGSRYARPGAADFPSNQLVRLAFEDQSRAEFRYAFVIKAPEWREIAVFTEHCGYHLFPLYDGLGVTVDSV